MSRFEFNVRMNMVIALDVLMVIMSWVTPYTWLLDVLIVLLIVASAQVFAWIAMER